MNPVYAILAFFIAIAAVLIGVSRVNSWLIERRHPPVGTFAEIAGTRLHYVHDPAPASPDLPPIVFIHGASANLKDQLLTLRRMLEGRAELLFWDRPGHGWSARGPLAAQTPFDQAKLLAGLMERLAIDNAVLVGHSFGGAVETAFALSYPKRVRGLVFLSAAMHPWPGGKTSWYYDWASLPVIGRLFVETVAGPAGALRVGPATECVFAPNAVPEAYLEKASIGLVLRPRNFRANARDVAGLYAYANAAAPRYKEIAAPTVIVSGDRDAVVAEEIHSIGLAKDIAGSQLVWVRNLGHKPEWIAPELVVGAIEKVAGRPVDLAALTREVETRIAADTFGAHCVDEPFDGGGLHPTPG